MAINVGSRNFLIAVVGDELLYSAIDNVLSQTSNTTIDSLKFFLAGTSTESNLVGLDGYEIVNLDENDQFSVHTYNFILSQWLQINSIQEFYSAAYNELASDLLDEEVNVSSVVEARAHLFSNKLFTLENSLAISFAAKAKRRLNIWRAAYLGTGFDDDELSRAEIAIISEDNALTDDQNFSDGLDNIYQLVLKLNPAAVNPGTLTGQFTKQVAGRELNTQELAAFARVFGKINPALIETVETGGLSNSNLKVMIDKMTELKIFELAGYAKQIGDFARKRTASTKSTQRSSADFVDLNVDTQWLTLLIDTMNVVRADPIFFANLIYYFPSLVTFLIDAIAVTSDYSNEGQGGSLDDTVNNSEAMIDSLEKAFGLYDGKKIFTLAASITNTTQRIRNALGITSTNPDPFRPNIAPKNPDIFHLRLGASNFYVPPVSINVNSSFKAGSLMAGALRQKNSPKFNSGYKETSITMRLFFPNYEEIWGLKIEDGANVNLKDDYQINFNMTGSSDEKIDKFLSSLRGLIAAFKYSPFLPIKNHYLNSVHGITAVGLVGMNISTIPNFPFALAVDLELVNFNHKPFLPMLSDFNQAIHWGKYRQYMGKAAISLNQYVNESFLLKTTDVKEVDTSVDEVVSRDVVWNGYEYRPVGNAVETLDQPDQQEDTPPNNSTVDRNVLTQNVIDDWTNGNHITLYAPAEAQTKLFLPSISSFRTDEEKMMNDLGRATWQDLLFSIGIDINESAGYGLSLSDTMDISRENAFSKSTKNIILDAINIITAGVNSSNYSDAVYDYFVTNFIIQNKKYFDDSKENDRIKKNWLKDRSDKSQPYSEVFPYIFQGKYIDSVSLNSVKDAFSDIADDPKSFLDYLVDKKIADQTNRNGLENTPDQEKVKEEFKKAFNVALYERFFQSGPIQALMEAARARAGAYQFNEWEVPMLRIDLDPNSVIVNGVTVSLGNNIVKLQLQMQDEPSYQHIGGRDSYINISMTIIGETELIKFKAIFDHITALARLEHASGVIGFLGIKNIITALSGIKYVMPLNYSVSTKPNYPHVYDVELSLVDFDIFQQKREELSNKQQADLVENFKTKKNPFLRIKQLWGSFNAYPDFPLQVKNGQGETVGCLDPDFYFRSFAMFDDDVINHVSYQRTRAQDFDITPEYAGDIFKEKRQILFNAITGFVRQYATIIDRSSETNIQSDVDALVQEIIDFIEYHNVTKEMFLRALMNVINDGDDDPLREISRQLLTSFIDFDSESSEDNQFLYREVQPAPYQVGSISPNQVTLVTAVEAALEGRYSLEGEEWVSFHPDEVEFHKQIFAIPAADKESLDNNRIPSILATSLGTYYGYIDKISGRFYLTIAGNNVKKSSSGDGAYSFAPNYVEDMQTPDKGTTNSLTGAYGTVALSEYQKPYSGDTANHWEKMLVDTKYRDISGRMIRAFPTYMLWLIDEGGYFAGVKLFDNFYGLQSIIDFSVVSSEDLLGDTLIFRVSNLYSKLTKKEASRLFSTDQDDYVPDQLSLSESLGGIIDRTLNMSRNLLSGLRNEYLVDIQNIRLKPGVRVHLRAGYGANPNSLQTLFNGVITNVEQGEIVTVTAQSDAIELGAVVNSTNKKGDSGKIDGGIDTGMYLSEPRDLMVRLLSMGSSRSREAIAHAARGTVFSENKFGIRHFGNILYQPLNEDEAARNSAVREKLTAAYQSVGGDNSADINGFSFNVRGGTLAVMGQVWSNFAAQVDLEIFKRNIYPGNGLGIAQFLGGDIDDGWSTVASLVPDETYDDRLNGGYLGRLTDLTYNRLLENYQNKDTSAKETLDNLTAQNKLIDNSRAGLTQFGLGAAGVAIGIAATSFAPVIGTVVAGASLLGALSGRGGQNIFRAMGLISPNPDDDVPGFDEVSFRAQTYMRTVWDLFQTCARLLPNYIVAVRPFEDRSTVFYGKPHWLYTSGVVPVTTGFPGEEKAAELGIITPRPVEPDQSLQTILDTLNRDTNPLSDYGAFFDAYEPNENFATTAQQISTSTGIYAPSTFFAGRLINFFSSRSNSYVDPVEGVEVIAKLPASYGYVDIGPHLPIIEGKTLSQEGTDQSSIFSEISIQENLHSQINNLPPRFRFPYFTVSESMDLGISSNYDIYPSWYNQVTEDSRSKYETYLELAELEINFFADTKFTIAPNLGDESAEGFINLDTPLDFSNLEADTAKAISWSGQFIRMPLPGFNTMSPREGLEGFESGEFSFEFADENYGELTYSEWGAPQTPEDEQFYIAMRWPYNPSGENLDDATLAQFKNKYGFENLYGTVDDYKNRKVLVYNPDNGRAVVCKPAYFLWGESEFDSETDYEKLDARVSPDAAYFLGVITINETEASNIDVGASNSWDITGDLLIPTDVISVENQNTAASSGFRFIPKPQRCYFSFVPDYIPVGVLSTSVSRITKFASVDASGVKIENAYVDPTFGWTRISTDVTVPVYDEDGEVTGSKIIDTNETLEYVVGFGDFSSVSGGTELLAKRMDISGKREINDSPNNPFVTYGLYETEYNNITDLLTYGGNPINIQENKSYFQATIDKEYGMLSQDELNKIINGEDTSASDVRSTFVPVWDPSDVISIQARQYWDENYDPTVSVIAGNGRTLAEASDIWNTFRAEYHNSESVKRIFFDIFGLDPNSDEIFPPVFKSILTGGTSSETGLELFRNSGDPTAADEFSILLGSDFITNTDVSDSTNSNQSRLEAIEFMRRNFIDADLDDGGLIQYYNNNIRKAFSSIRKSFFDEGNVAFLDFLIEADPENDSATIANTLLEKIQSPKQLFLLMVGIFRQRMWEDPYARAWLVLKPDKKPGWWGKSDKWSFKSVDPIFRAFINPYQDYAKPSKKAKFLQLLVANKGEGNSSNTYFAEAVDDLGTFVSRSVGPLFKGIGDALTGLMSMFKLSMQQLGYGLSEIGNFKRQANILNKALNDSIYYSLGRPGTLLRAVDNPFTREYGEPVVEIREPFQRLHYISSFSHILSNQIQENLNGVSTVITAVSDGKYPVSVALDKGAPAERQTESTVETGIIFDNFVGSGVLTGILHPFMHPLETFRGVAKNIQGTPDELSARRIAGAHLKESIKDIYGGELIVIGNPDIRPHDLVYLSDVYERMYGIFEVEQVVHHFTSELGFITSITPNALVTVNDPARWFMTSWMQSWMHVQNIRNDARIYLDNIRNANSGLAVGGNVSLDRLGEILGTQLIGGLQYTHGSSALVKDIMATEAAKLVPGANQSAIAAEASKGEEVGGVPKFATMAAMVPLIGPLAWKGWKWVRDNVLDQHGCYVQYLNKNGQPMDAGLSYNQGMVVGQHHSKSLLPGILGVRSKTRTPEGNAYIRTDDLFKSLGWSETAISEVTRYISYESSLVHARVLDLAGLGPDKAGFDWQFKVICKVTNILDGDTIDVEDIVSGATFRVRFDGINTSETNVMEGKLDYPDTNNPTTLSLLDISTPGGMAKIFVNNAIKDKIVVIRVNQTRTNITVDTRATLTTDFEAGSIRNNIQNYQLDIFGRSSDGTIEDGTSTPRALGTIFYKAAPEALSSATTYVANIFRRNINDLTKVKEIIKSDFYDSSSFYLKFDFIYDAINATVGKEYYNINDPTDMLNDLSEEDKAMFSSFVYMKLLEEIYDTASRWPRIEWDEYYSDGTPITLNWELVLNNLARVFVKDLQKESESVQTANESVPGL